MPFALWKIQEKDSLVVQDVAGVLEVLKALRCQMNSIFRKTVEGKPSGWLLLQCELSRRCLLHCELCSLGGRAFPDVARVNPCLNKGRVPHTHPPSKVMRKRAREMPEVWQHLLGGAPWFHAWMPLFLLWNPLFVPSQSNTVNSSLSVPLALGFSFCINEQMSNSCK